MKKILPSKIPRFKNDAEAAEFMAEHSPFDLLDVGLAEIVSTPSFRRMKGERKTLLKYKRVQVAFKDERSIQRKFSSFGSSARTFFVIDTDPTGILLGLPETPASESFYVPYLNISGIKILDGPKRKTASKITQRRAL